MENIISQSPAPTQPAAILEPAAKLYHIRLGNKRLAVLTKREYKDVEAAIKARHGKWVDFFIEAQEEFFVVE